MESEYISLASLPFMNSAQKIIFKIPGALEQFELVQLIPIRIFCWDISYTNSSFFIILGLGFLLLLKKIIFMGGRGSLLPNRWQALLEGVYKFIGETVMDNIGEKGRVFFPFVFSLFLFLLTVNLIGMVPYAFTATSHLIVTLFLALIVYIGVNFLLFNNHGYHGLSLFLPQGAPFLLVPTLILIEFISNLIRVVSLSVRLFANIIAGHILLNILLGFAWGMIINGGFYFLLHLLPLFIVYILLFIETAVAIIQAYVFVALTCIYLNESINLH